ncbi:hypothetical protein R1sor_002353 [Riccia sorocarpa]|uniref:Enoyl reductase (ER) domain-containing protein n=1 Tax=Riccia sorocarpa TaxID=122646 RepID=A0ABD3H0P7_9MARC
MAGTEVTNRKITLKRYVEGWPKESDLELVTTKEKLELRGEKDLIVRVLYLSCDPFLRWNMSKTQDPYAPPFAPGEPIAGYALGKVLLSSDPNFKEGDIVSGLMEWADYAHRYTQRPNSLTKVGAEGVPLSYYLGILGMPGFTAYAGFFKVCEPKKGETIYVSAAAGAVGQMVGQFAKAFGCRVVGSAGSPRKVDLLKSKFGYDEAFNYKEENDLDAALKRYCPGGIDMYFENVGGKMLDAVLLNIKDHGRIAVCGMISQYNKEEPDPIYNLTNLIKRRVKMQGFLINDYNEDVQPEFLKNVTEWYKEGKVHYVEDLAVGLEKAPAAFIGMLEGKNVGKQSVKVSDP